MNGIRRTEMGTREHLNQMKAILDARFRDDVRVLALIVALGAGLRSGEVRGLNVEDFKPHEGEPVLDVMTLKRRGKVVKRMIPISSSDAAMLTKYIVQQHG